VEGRSETFLGCRRIDKDDIKTNRPVSEHEPGLFCYAVYFSCDRYRRPRCRPDCLLAGRVVADIWAEEGKWVAGVGK
jgi:hypothetical protein